MPEKLIDRIKVFEVYYSIGINRSITKLHAALSGRYKNSTLKVPSEGTLKKWSVRYKWLNQVVIRDNAAAEGVAEKMTEAMVDTKMKELEHLDKAMSEIDAVMPLIFDALQSCTATDPKTGKKHVKIIPDSTQDMTALYNAQSRFVTAKTKLIETMRKVQGETDNVNLKTVLEVRYEDLKEDARD